MKRDWTIAHQKIREEGNRCRVNGCKNDASDAAHVAPRSLGGGQGAAATIPLCRDHHRRYDTDRDFDLGPHLTWEEQAECVAVIGLHAAHKRLFPSEHPNEGRIYRR